MLRARVDNVPELPVVPSSPAHFDAQLCPREMCMGVCVYARVDVYDVYGLACVYMCVMCVVV